jgi:hypothetical protein
MSCVLLKGGPVCDILTTHKVVKFDLSLICLVICSFIFYLIFSVSVAGVKSAFRRILSLKVLWI